MALNKTGIGTKTGKDPGLFPQYNQPELPSGVSNAGHNVHDNISMQAGEEFSVNFGHDGIVAARVPGLPDISRNSENRFGLNRENGHVRYEDLTNILGLRRMDSESSSDIVDFISIKLPAQEMENGASVIIFPVDDPLRLPEAHIGVVVSGGGHFVDPNLRGSILKSPEKVYCTLLYLLYELQSSFLNSHIMNIPH